MRLNNKLAQWQQAGLINEQTARSILEHEANASRPLALWAAGGVGAFAIVVGIVSIVAANWLHTPDAIKIGGALLINALLAIAIYNNAQQSQHVPKLAAGEEKQWLTEVLVVIYYGFTLASMALIGQIYQLDGSTGMLLLTWTLATLPLVLLARGKFIATLWVIGTAVTYCLNIAALYDFLTGTLNLDRDVLEAIALSMVLIGPLIFIALSRIPWLVQERPIYAAEISRYSWLVIIAGGFLAQFLWYEAGVIHSGTDQRDVLTVLALTGMATAATLMGLPKLYAQHATQQLLAMRVVLISVFILIFAACWHNSSMPIVGALTNLAYLVMLAWAALKTSSTPLFNLITAAISIRVLFIYFEIFGSMMQTGIGLVIGGVLTLLLAWLWFKKSNHLAMRLQEKEHDSKEKANA